MAALLAAGCAAPEASSAPAESGGPGAVQQAPEAEGYQPTCYDFQSGAMNNDSGEYALIIRGKDGASVEGSFGFYATDMSVAMADSVAAFGYDETDETQAEEINAFKYSLMDDLADLAVQAVMAKTLGITLTQEEQTGLKASVGELKDEIRSQLLEELAIEEEFAGATDEVRQVEADARLKAFLDAYGYTDEVIYRQQELYLLSDKLSEEAAKEVTVSDEDIQQRYDEMVADEKSSYAESAMYYEYAVILGSDTYYIPEGFKHIKHILFAITDEQAAELEALEEDGKTDEATEKREQYMSEAKKRAEAVLPQVTAEKFDALIEQYSDDAEGSASFPDGYVVGPNVEDTYFEPEFTAAAATLQNPGDITKELVESNSGYHILLYASPVESRTTPLDEVKEDLRASLLEEKQADALNQKMEEWRGMVEIEKFPEALGVDEEAAKAYEEVAAAEGDTQEGDAELPEGDWEEPEAGDDAQEPEGDPETPEDEGDAQGPEPEPAE